MTLPELCIRRPVFTTMVIALPVTLGLFSYFNMGVDLFPNVDLPIVTITTTRSGTSVEEMETGVTKVLEEAVNTISGIDELRSTTKEGISSLNITFVLEKNRDVAQQEVQSKINTILSRLPTGTDAPIIDKFDVDASPVMTIAVSGHPIRIRDIGAVADSYEEPRSIGRLDGDNAVLLVVQKQSGTNTVEVIDIVKRKLAQLGESFAAEGRGDLRMETIRDQSRFINASLHEVKKHLVLGAMLVGLTILLFLRDWRTMVIASLSIPVSLVSTFMVMKWLGFTLNNITMLAMVLAVGIVIDDAVVVHENIFRWMEEKGLGAWDAALGATKELALALVATTLSLVVIFLPIAFMSGRVGRFFFSFGVTTAVAILMSMLVSFTMTPMLCSRFLKLSKHAREQGAAHHSGGIYGRFVEKPYLWTLRWSMRHRWAIILATIAVFLSVGYLGKIIGKDFLPKDDQSEFEIAITTPEGWTLDRTDRTFREIEGRLKAMPQVTNLLTTIGD